ncbi:MAG: cadherin-like domain-containing protein, partial [Rhodospirillales bacterium]|nr:cadherin-like domain-containing protein [Rhodospirillales bacterium]
MAEFSDSVAGNEDQATSVDFRLEATDGGSLSLPDGFSISDANFESNGPDLILTSADGAHLTVEGFFSQDNPPELVTADGAQISGDMASQLAGGGQEISAGTDAGTAPAADGMIASNPTIITGTDGGPIGNVENLSGSVFAVRTDGTRVDLKEGDPVYQGDIIESSDDGAVGILLADETTFSMGESGRIVLDEMVYDPATQEGSVSLSALEGVFTFVSGQVAKTDPDAMTLDTPVATIGIRGTQVGLDIGGEGDAGKISDNGDGTWTYSPGDNFDGNLPLAYDLNDGTTDNAVTSTFSIVGDSNSDALSLAATKNADGTYTIRQEDILSATRDDADFLSALENTDAFNAGTVTINDLNIVQTPRMSVVLMEEADGFVGEIVIANDGGIQVLNKANESTSVANFQSAPTEIRVIDTKELVSSYGNALK